MAADRDRADVLPEGREVAFRMSSTVASPPDVVYDVIADVGTHLDWGGTRGSKKYRLTAVDVQDGPAVKGSEWTSTGIAPDGTFRDRSVVTEASRPSAFEFQTDAHIAFRKGGEGDWRLINRYEITPEGKGSRVAYTQRLIAATPLGPMKMMLNPLLGGIGRMMVKGLNKPAMRGLAAMAEEKARGGAS